jgi:hypothetical protein
MTLNPIDGHLRALRLLKQFLLYPSFEQLVTSFSRKSRMSYASSRLKGPQGGL